MSTIIIITPPPPPPPTKPQRQADDFGGYSLHTVGGELSRKEQREILRALLKDLRDE